MIAQEITSTTTPTRTAALDSLMVQPEAAVSDAPLYTPEAAGVLLALLLLSPKEPKEPRDK
ncbi:hypothetical protein [Streptomyces nitrosporeus]|uniref:Uncharacterized protein n=1 Tax=Streptomyces nitrosporeus TaxID=28894 RepID=A0A5J6F5K1_9ACTN|nr:hypothetical protein [Streptomyces nitrosporeus]QEU71296.1 hypothetical protein CP967_04395 [Streptomyces nitrosporeus]GGY99013.1 hypothetical protein GCM10010327_32040 [Streptomyces nitrosporeus]